MICERSFQQYAIASIGTRRGETSYLGKAWNIPVVARMIKAADREEVTRGMKTA